MGTTLVVCKRGLAVSCARPSANPRNTGQGEGRGLAAEGTRGAPGPHQVVQLRVGREQRPLGADLGGRREARQGGPASCPASPAASPWCFALGLPTCLAKAAISSLKESEEQTSPPGGEPSPAEAPSRGEHVASSHFSKTRAKSGKRGCLWRQESGPSRGEAGSAQRQTQGHSGEPLPVPRPTHP